MNSFEHPLKNIMNQVPENSHGYTGLVNVGNTCFLNSCIQIINHIYELTPIYETVFVKNKNNSIPETQFFNEWIDLHRIMWQKDGLICPLRFVHVIQQLATLKNRQLFTGFSQNDIHEFILFFIESLHISISRNTNIVIYGNAENETDQLAIKCYNYLQNIYKNEYSEILNMFYGIYVSKINSIDETHTVHSIIPEHFFILDLPIPYNKNNDPSELISESFTHSQSHTIYDCFNLFTKEENMYGDNSWFNESTGKKEDVNKRIEFWNFPDILIISLKRFSPCGQYKLHGFIDFPIKSLDLSQYVTGYNPQSYKYDLFGVCNHFGECNGGHYTAYVLNYLNEWMHYNDGNVERGITNIVTADAYCLFYRKIR